MTYMLLVFGTQMIYCSLQSQLAFSKVHPLYVLYILHLPPCTMRENSVQALYQGEPVAEAAFYKGVDCQKHWFSCLPQHEVETPTKNCNQRAGTVSIAWHAQRCIHFSGACGSM
jgi:hypothetical protein